MRSKCVPTALAHQVHAHSFAGDPMFSSIR